MFTVGSASLAPEEISEWVRGIQIVLTNRKETSSLLTFSLSEPPVWSRNAVRGMEGSRCRKD